MSAVTLGPAIGKGYVPGYGSGVVFDSDRKDYFTIQVDKTGVRHWVRRDRVQWRKSK